jgi:hypothetical protein
MDTVTFRSTICAISKAKAKGRKFLSPDLYSEKKEINAVLLSFITEILVISQIMEM